MFTAWQANLIAIVGMLDNEVIKPNDCRIVKIVEFNTSLHIYNSDIEYAKKIELASINPQTNYR